ncbi:hypothetical protein QBC39DRAFT_326726 [Podospora conica]|nr:hypothetical protein QBC39DRAFT_326726 [Schizothecium conicum]
MSNFSTFPGDPGHQAQLPHEPYFSFDFEPYGSFGDDKLAPPPPPPAEQPTFFSTDCDFLTQFVTNFAAPNFSDKTFDYPQATPQLGLDAHHTADWLVGHSTHYGPLGASELPMPDLSQTLFLEPDSNSHPMGSLQPNDPEVLAAASTLSRTTCNGMNQGSVFNPPPPPPGSTYHYQGHPPGGYMPPATHSTPRHNAGFPGMLDPSRFGPRYTPALPNSQVQVHYGSDESFNKAQFQPRSQEDTLKDISSRQTALLSCLTRQSTPASSRLPSPEPQGQFVPANGPPQAPPGSARRRRQDGDDFQDGGEPLSKRRKSSLIKEESPVDGAEEAMLDTPSAMTPTQKQQGKRPSLAKEPKTTKAPASRRKKETAAQKKRNLTDAERRANHIDSEARRRIQVVDAFATLRTLVPGIEKGKSLSRNDMLTAIGDFTLDLKEGNERLEALLGASQTPPS